MKNFFDVCQQNEKLLIVQFRYEILSDFRARFQKMKCIFCICQIDLTPMGNTGYVCQRKHSSDSTTCSELSQQKLFFSVELGLSNTEQCSSVAALDSSLSSFKTPAGA